MTADQRIVSLRPGDGGGLSCRDVAAQLCSGVAVSAAEWVPRGDQGDRKGGGVSNDVVEHRALAPPAPTQAARAVSAEPIGSLRRPTQRERETCAIPSRAAACERFAEFLSATSLSAAFSISASDMTAARSMSH